MFSWQATGKYLPFRARDPAATPDFPKRIYLNQDNDRKVTMRSDSRSALFLDFDGVLVSSLEIKTNAYKRLFRSHGPNVVAQVVAHHQLNAGISRVEKIDHAHRHFLDAPYSRNAAARDVTEYACLVFEQVVSANWVPGAREFIERHYRDVPLFIVSGTPEPELKEIVRRRNMQHFFREVLGSPRKKAEHIRALLDNYDLKAENCFFIGDALTDYHAARDTGMPFIGIEGEAELPAGTTVLPDCTGLTAAIAEYKKRSN